MLMGQTSTTLPPPPPPVVFAVSWCSALWFCFLWVRCCQCKNKGVLQNPGVESTRAIRCLEAFRPMKHLLQQGSQRLCSTCCCQASVCTLRGKLLLLCSFACWPWKKHIQLSVLIDSLVTVISSFWLLSAEDGGCT